MDLISIHSAAGGAVSVHVREQQFECRHDAALSTSPDLASPVELCVASLGACIGLSIGAYCRSHGYLDGAAAVYLTYQMGETPRRVIAITMDVEMPRDFPTAKRDVITRLIKNCPIYQTLQDPPHIDIDIV